jgi:hypothetical protein
MTIMTGFLNFPDDGLEVTTRLTEDGKALWVRVVQATPTDPIRFRELDLSMEQAYALALAFKKLGVGYV